MEHSDVTSILNTRPLLANRFEILDVLGQGGAGAVYRVRDRANDQRELALKVLTDVEAFDEHTLARFREEFRICQSLNHPNLVRAYDLLELEDAIAFSMEYVDGLDLALLIGRRRFSYKMIDDVIGQVLSALHLLHSKGILHRDIKLENVLIAKDGTVKLADLGLVKDATRETLTRTGILLGTVRYMPPEYIKNSRYDARSDIYCVGMMMFEMLTGKRRLSDLSGNEAIAHLIKTKFKVPIEELADLPEKYRYIVQRALDPRPGRRFPTALEMKAALAAPCSGRAKKAPGAAAGKNGGEYPPLVLNDRQAQLVRRPRRGIAMVLAGRVGVVLVVALLTILGAYASSALAPLNRLKPGNYQGLVNGLSSTGSLDKMSAIVSGSRMSFFVSEKPCDYQAPASAAPQLLCQGKTYSMVVTRQNSSGMSGHLLAPGSGVEHIFFIERQ